MVGLICKYSSLEDHRPAAHPEQCVRVARVSRGPGPPQKHTCPRGRPVTSRGHPGAFSSPSGTHPTIRRSALLLPRARTTRRRRGPLRSATRSTFPPSGTRSFASHVAGACIIPRMTNRSARAYGRRSNGAASSPSAAALARARGCSLPGPRRSSQRSAASIARRSISIPFSSGTTPDPLRIFRARATTIRKFLTNSFGSGVAGLARCLELQPACQEAALAMRARVVQRRGGGRGGTHQQRRFEDPDRALRGITRLLRPRIVGGAGGPVREHPIQPRAQFRVGLRPPGPHRRVQALIEARHRAVALLSVGGHTREIDRRPSETRPPKLSSYDGCAATNAWSSKPVGSSGT